MFIWLCYSKIIVCHLLKMNEYPILLSWLLQSKLISFEEKSIAIAKNKKNKTFICFNWKIQCIFIVISSVFFYIFFFRKQCGQVILDVLKENPVDDVLAHIHQIASTLCMASEDSGMLNSNEKFKFWFEIYVGFFCFLSSKLYFNFMCVIDSGILVLICCLWLSLIFFIDFVYYDISIQFPQKTWYRFDKMNVFVMTFHQNDYILVRNWVTIFSSRFVLIIFCFLLLDI